VDADSATAGTQPYANPSGVPILTLAGTRFFGPSQEWPQELQNYPYIEFWHRLDEALAAASIPGMGPELLGDAAWRELFSTGALTENPGIMVTMSTRPRLDVTPLTVDQLGRSRSGASPGDIGAIEVP
jgi:hypothetical protein